MISELRRRAYLSAMQVASWLPVQVLPFAAASRAELLAEPPAAEPPARDNLSPVEPAAAAAAPVAARGAGSGLQDVRARMEQPSASVQTPVEVAVEAVEMPSIISPVEQVPRFTLQLYRAGACMLLVELPTGEAFQSRDPGYLLLKDMLRAAGLPESPQLIGDPVRWPFLAGGNHDQGPSAAREFLQGYVAARKEDHPGCVCLWLVGLPAMRHAGEVEAERYNQELEIEGLGSAWAIPGLELLMDEPQRKASLWQAMRRLMPRWAAAND